MAKTYSELLNGANTIKNETVAGANTATRVGTELVDIVEKIQQVDTDGLDLGTTPESAFRGDYGQEAYQHANTDGNPHNTVASEIGSTPAGGLSATTVQGAINELDSEKVGKTTKINGYSLNSDINLSKSDVGLSNVDNTSDANKPISEATQNALSLKADLVGGKVPSAQLPAYVDDVLEYATLAGFPSTGESGKIYVAINTNLTYRWSGTAYVEISKSLALGETPDTAYRGDRGKTAYDHSQTTGNPHGTTAAQVSNTPAGSVAATTVQGAINELAGDIVQVETDLNGIAELVKYTGQWYGVECDTTVSSSALTRIGNMSLHYLLPIQSKMRRCLLLDNGVVNYYLHPTDSTKKEDGSNAILDGTDGQVMVEIPEFYYEFQSNLTKNRVLLSEYPILKNKSNKVYISAYEAALDRTNLKLSSVVNNTSQFRGGNNAAANDGTSKTLLGRPVTRLSLTQFRTYARNRGSINWNCNAYLVQKILYWLIAVEYGNFNNQLAYNPALTAEGYRQGGLGNGVTDLNDSKWNSFNGYYPFIPCGHTNSLGNSTGIVSYQMPAEYDPVILTTNVPSYRGVENPFGHLWKWTDGCKCNIQSDASGGISEFYVCNNPTNYQDADYANYVLRGLIPRGNGYIKSLIIGDSGEIMPLSVGGSSTTYMCDHFYTSIPASGVDQRGVLFGGSANYGAGAGVGCSFTNNTATGAGANVGSRLCYII